MTTIALPRPLHTPGRPSSPVPPMPILSLDSINTSSACPVPIPNKHIPVCPTGPVPSEKPDTPPASPPTKYNEIPSHSLLFPPDNYTKISSQAGEIYSIDANAVAAALDHISGQSLPESSEVFPWLHGLHPQNQVQQAFFIARRRSLRKTPRCLRGITIIKADGDLACSRLKGAISPEEILQCGKEAQFKEIDPKDGFSVRNFQIQACKTSMVSDVIVYGNNEAETKRTAWKVAAAQRSWRDTHEKAGHELPRYNTFICTSSFDAFEADHPELVSTNSKGQMTGNVMDFFYQERYEMSSMTEASEIAPNVWLGPTPDPSIHPSLLEKENSWDVLIDCSDVGRLNVPALESVAKGTSAEPVYLEFPSSGSIMPPSWSLTETDAIISSLQWIRSIATGEPVTPHAGLDFDGDSPMPDSSNTPRKILIHCTDGYTETSLLALAYYIYVTGCPVSQAWLQLHMQKQRNFFAYPSDVALLNAITPRILEHSPALAPSYQTGSAIATLLKAEPAWLANLDGSLPSRITDYMYLGNLGHANNPELLRALGIGQLLSVGEMASWSEAEMKEWGEENVLRIQGVQDNGVDELWGEFGRCLDFIGKFSHY